MSRERIKKFITGVAKKINCKLYSIYANPEHVDFLLSRSPQISEEYIAGIIEESTTKFINENKLTNSNFSWQSSASAFSISKKDVDRVCKYILNQKNTIEK